MQTVTPSIESFSGILSIGLISYLTFCFFAGQCGFAQAINISDNFDIGYIKQVEFQPIQQCQTERIKPKQKKQEPTVNPVIEDCIGALVSLGCKKSTAKKEVQTHFDNHNSVESFLKDYFKKTNKQ
jgi:hypothetical protein